MRRFRCSTSGDCGRRRWIAGIAAALLLAAGGCRTSGDATAAASQMAKTSQTLCDYYKALGTTFSNTNELFELNEALYGKPYSAQARQQMKTNEAELAKRARLASDLATLSGNFGKLSGSTAPSDLASSAAQVASDAAGLAGVTASAAEQDALRGAVLALATAIQEHREREAAKAMEAAAQSLSDLFAKESDVWKSTEQVDSQIAANLAGNLVDQKATDNTAVLDVALTPFGLAPASLSDDLNAKLAPVARQQIAAKHASMDAAYGTATDSMAKALQVMAQRIQTVANDKPMAFRAAPLSLDDVLQWTTQVTKSENQPASDAASSVKSKKTGSGQEK
jgi:hypothetical protein